MKYLNGYNENFLHDVYLDIVDGKSSKYSPDAILTSLLYASVGIASGGYEDAVHLETILNE